MAEKNNPFASIIDNPILKKLALGRLKSGMINNGITSIQLIITPEKELDFETFTEPVKVLTVKDYETLLNLATK